MVATALQIDEQAALQLGLEIIDGGVTKEDIEISSISFKQGFEEAYQETEQSLIAPNSKKDEYFIELFLKSVIKLKIAKRFRELPVRYYHLGYSLGIVLGFIDKCLTNPVLGVRFVTYTMGKSLPSLEIKSIAIEYRQELNQFDGRGKHNIHKGLKLIARRLRQIEKGIKLKEPFAENLLKQLIRSLSKTFS